MKTVEKCPFCEYTQRDHQCNHWFAMRRHVQDKHPAEYAELKATEKNIREQKDAALKRFGCAFDFLYS